MSSSQRENQKTAKSTKQYQPEFPLVYDKLHGPYAAISNKEDSLARNFINLLLTSPGEWPMNPDLGIGLRRYLFESSTSDLVQRLRPNIVSQLQKYLPHIKLHSIEVQQEPEDIDNNTIKIKINCVIMNTTFASIIAHMDKLTKLVVDYKKIKQILDNNSSLVPRLDSDLFSRQVTF